MSQGRRNNIITSVRAEMTTRGQMRLACARSWREGEKKKSKNYEPVAGLFCIINYSHFIYAYQKISNNSLKKDKEEKKSMDFANK